MTFDDLRKLVESVDKDSKRLKNGVKLKPSSRQKETVANEIYER